MKTQMKRRRILPFLLAVCVTVGPGAFIENPNDYVYTVEDGKATITEYLGDGVKLIIPSKLDGVPVVAIGDGVFAGSDIEMIEIPDSVTEIGEGAFSNCQNLYSVNVPPSVKFIGEGAFAGCPHITVWTTETGYVADYLKENGISLRLWHT